MAILTTGTLIVGGVILGLGAIGALWASLTEKGRARKKIEELENQNTQLNRAKTTMQNLNNKVTKAKEYLTDGKKIFKDGGHVHINEPLAGKEINACCYKLDDVLKNSNNLINDIDATINANNQAIQKERSKL